MTSSDASLHASRSRSAHHSSGSGTFQSSLRAHIYIVLLFCLANVAVRRLGSVLGEISYVEFALWLELTSYDWQSKPSPSFIVWPLASQQNECSLTDVAELLYCGFVTSQIALVAAFRSLVNVGRLQRDAITGLSLAAIVSTYLSGLQALHPDVMSDDWQVFIVLIGLLLMFILVFERLAERQSRWRDFQYCLEVFPLFAVLTAIWGLVRTLPKGRVRDTLPVEFALTVVLGATALCVIAAVVFVVLRSRFGLQVWRDGDLSFNAKIDSKMSLNFHFLLISSAGAMFVLVRQLPLQWTTFSGLKWHRLTLSLGFCLAIAVAIFIAYFKLALSPRFRLMSIHGLVSILWPVQLIAGLLLVMLLANVYLRFEVTTLLNYLTFALGLAISSLAILLVYRWLGFRIAFASSDSARIA